MSVRIRELAEVEAIPGIDPHCLPAVIAAEAHTRGGRAVVVEVEHSGLEMAYPLILEPGGPTGVLARTPEYGGPWPREGIPTPAALAAVRAELDRVLPQHGVISEVFMLAPRLPQRAAVAAAWRTSPGKEIRLVVPAAVASGSGLRKGRRSDLARARREFTPAVGPLELSRAEAFAARYGTAMEEMAAEARWRRDAEYFRVLATGEPGVIVAATNSGGGAEAIFLVAGAFASYAYSVRWNASGTATTLVVATACEVLADMGVETLTLGGGATDSPEDPLLDFKRSWGGESVAFEIGARVYDESAHETLVGLGAARPLPVGTVAP